MRIGFVGLGLMGSAMAERLLQVGIPLSVHNRTEAKAKPLLDRGAAWCRSVYATAAGSDLIFTMLSDPAALETVSAEIAAGLPHGAIHVDCSTVSPALTRRLEAEYRGRGVVFLHMPVLGSVIQAREGLLLLFAGGSDEGFRRVEPVLHHLGTKVWRFDRAEQATTMKLICNSFIAGMMLVLDQALLMAAHTGIDQRTLLDIVGQSALAAPMYETKGASTIARNFAPRFFVEHLLKDVRLVRDAGRDTGIPMPVAELAEQLFARAVEMGLAKEDYSAVIKVLEKDVVPASSAGLS